MTVLNKRAFTLTVGTVELSNLDCKFKVKKSLKPEPNTCNVEVYNLAATTRAKLESSKSNILRLEAGYNTDVSLLYLGNIRAVYTTTDGPTKVTHLETGDSEKEIQASRINVPVGPKTPADVALRAIAKTLGVKAGNIEAAIAKLKTKAGLALFPSATILSGSTARYLQDFCNSAGLEWSIQDGALQILDKGKALETSKAILLSAATGLTGSPTVDFKDKKLGAMAKCLMIPELGCGRKVVFDTEGVKGGYRIHTIEYDGDFAGNDWYATIFCEKY